MGNRDLRRRCRELLRRLGIQAPLDVAELCHRISEHRGKPIRLISYPIPVPGPFGAWLAGKDVDYILYQRETSPAHQSHIIIHELVHILADHASDEGDNDLLHELCPDSEPEIVRRALRRPGYNNQYEREAETAATIILEWASVLDHVQPAALTPAAGSKLDQRLDVALRDRMGWL